MNVTELSRRVNIPSKRLFEILPELGFDIGKRAIKVDERVAQRIITKLSRPDVRAQYLTVKTATDTSSSSAEESPAAAPSTPGVIRLPSSISVRDFAERLGIPVTRAIIELMKQGVMAAQNQRIDYETAAIIAGDFGKTVVQETEEVATATDTDREQSLSTILAQQDQTRLQPRPPVIVVMGHVDHGKTKLLDAIRKTNVAAQESGGITQHIGAYSVSHQGKAITFIDTPGHEAFTAMRSRGARVADIAILVVAADDGVQPQTIEALSHIQRAELPFIVAINKIDKDAANPERIKQDLAQVNVTPEEWGGTTPFALISAKNGTGITELLDLILLLAEVEKEHIVADPTHTAVGTIIESHIDKGEGPVATALVQSGTLIIGTHVFVGNAYGKIKAMRDFQGAPVMSAPPSMPVKLLGLKQLPQVGDILQATHDKEAYKQKMRGMKSKGASLTFEAQTAQRPHDQEHDDAGEASGPHVNLFLRADVLGSLEAIHEALRTVHHPDVAVKTVYQGLGRITEADILTAEATHALIIGFNVTASLEAERLAKEKGIPLKRFSIIYEIVDEVKNAVEQKLAPFTKDTSLGTLTVIALFRHEHAQSIIGCRVTSGKIPPGTSFKLIRKDAQIAVGKILTTQIGQHTVKEVSEGQECGMKVECKASIKPGDIIEAFRRETITPTLQSSSFHSSSKD